MEKVGFFLIFFVNSYNPLKLLLLSIIITRIMAQAQQPQLPENKQGIIDMFAQKNGDTGSPEVQIALLSYKISKLSNHLDINKKDNHSRRGLLKVIAKRRRILNYLQKLDEKRYKELLKKLGLKK